jgi:hypothetical protein
MENKILKAVAGSNDTALQLGNVSLECYVLEDGSRVFSGNGLQKALEFSKSAGGTALVNMLNTGELKNIITDEIKEKLESRKEFHRPGAGGVLSTTYGYDATLLIDICDLLIEGKNQGKLTPRQIEYAKVAEIIIRSTAKVGITALVDEVTGYQDIRAKDALRVVLDEYLRKEFATWAKTFPDEFYRELFRLRGWEFVANNVKRPGVVGTYTKDLVYERLAPDILEELEKKNPKTEKGYRKQRHHQWLTDDVGHPKLREHLYGLLGFMRVCGDGEWDKFYDLIEKAYPKKTGQMKILFEDYEHQEKKQEKPLSSFDKSLKKALDYNPNKDNKKKNKEQTSLF